MQDFPHSALLDEVKRIRRVSDQLCTAHAAMRDMYRRRAMTAEFLSLLISAWLIGTALSDEKYSLWLSPFDFDPKLWSGLLAIFAFMISLSQILFSWRARSEAHENTFKAYSSLKSESSGLLLSEGATIGIGELQRLKLKYDLAGESGARIEDRLFNQLKRQHLIKVELSRMLDSSPGMNPFIGRIRIIIRDTFRSSRDLK